MESLSNYLVESSVLVTSVGLLYTLFLRNETSYRFNRYFLTSGLLISLLIPLISFRISTPIPRILDVQILPEVAINSLQNSTVITSILYRYDEFLIVYLLVCLLLTIRFAYRLSRLYLVIHQHGAKYQTDGAYFLVETQGKLPTCSFFNYLFWDNSMVLSDLDAERIRQHELTHIHHKHSWDMLLSESLKIVFWFNPFIYLVNTQLKMVHEYLADQQVLKYCQTSEYQHLMLKQLFHVHPMVFSHPFNQSQLLKRMKMMNNSKNISIWKLASASLLIGGAAILLSCEDPQVMIKEDAKVEGEIFQQVDTPASFVGGLDAFRRYLVTNLNYPAQAQENDISGVVYVQFVITKNGEITEVQVAKGIESSLDEEAMRVLSNSPNWTPASHNGVTVNQIMVAPIRFTIDKKAENREELVEIKVTK